MFERARAGHVGAAMRAEVARLVMRCQAAEAHEPLLRRPRHDARDHSTRRSKASLDDSRREDGFERMSGGLRTGLIRSIRYGSSESGVHFQVVPVIASN